MLLTKSIENFSSRGFRTFKNEPNKATSVSSNPWDGSENGSHKNQKEGQPETIQGVIKFRFENFNCSGRKVAEVCSSISQES